MFGGWHNVEAYAIHLIDRSQVYVPALIWWVECEASRFLGVRPPPVASYYAQKMMNTTGVEKSVLWHILLSKLLVSIVLNFLECARHGPSSIALYLDQLALSVSGVLVPLPTRVFSAVCRMGFFTIVSRTGFDLHLSHMVFNSSLKVDWCSAPTPHVHFPYDWNQASVFDVPT